MKKKSGPVKTQIKFKVTKEQYEKGQHEGRFWDSLNDLFDQSARPPLVHVTLELEDSYARLRSNIAKKASAKRVTKKKRS